MTTRSPVPAQTAAKPFEGARRSEILQIAAGLFATSGYVRTSLKDVADACGILPGSLYHHFDSKEAIAVELLVRYYHELDEIARLFEAAGPVARARPTVERMVSLGTAIADCAVRHRAALQLSVYEPQGGASAELIQVAARKPAAATAAMASILQDGKARDEISAAVDTGMLALQLFDSMLHVGLESLHSSASSQERAEMMCLMLLYGIAVSAPPDPVLDASEAMLAAADSVRRWSLPGPDDADHRRAVLGAAARAEFARRGYEATTIRDIAAAAGMGTGTVYRLIESKEALLLSIMDSFHLRLSGGYDAVAATGSTAVEKIDALSWLNINVVDRFRQEMDIQRAWFRSSPPRASSPVESLRHRAECIRDIVAAGQQHGELRHTGMSLELLAPCIRDLLWLPSAVVDTMDNPGVLAFGRATLLRGAATTSGRATMAAPEVSRP